MRIEFQKKIALIEGGKLVFVDESGVDTFVSRQYGRAPRGKKIHGEISGKRFTRQSFVAVKAGSKIIAPMIYEGTCHSELFETWVEQVLLPELISGQTIVLDNATFHKSLKTKNLIERAGCNLLFLPPYSPYFNPIEKFWAWLKKRLREIINSFQNLQDALIFIFKTCNYN